MFKSFLLLAFIFTLNSQEVIRVISGIRGSTATILESKLLKELEILYNEKNKDKIKFISTELPTFQSQFDTLHNSIDKDHIFIMNSITITDERKIKYDFSSPYIPLKTVLISSMNDSNLQNKNILFIAKTVHEQSAKSLAKDNKMKLISFSNLNELLTSVRSNKNNYAILDNVTTWNEKNIVILKELFNGKMLGCGLVYKKNSALKNRLDATLIYLIKSKRFYAICEEAYGTEIATYFKNQLK